MLDPEPAETADSPALTLGFFSRIGNWNTFRTEPSKWALEEEEGQDWSLKSRFLFFKEL